MERLLLPVLLGTNRKNRNSLRPARWLVGEMEKRAEIQTTSPSFRGSVGNASAPS